MILRRTGNGNCDLNATWNVVAVEPWSSNQRFLGCVASEEVAVAKYNDAVMKFTLVVPLLEEYLPMVRSSLPKDRHSLYQDIVCLPQLVSAGVKLKDVSKWYARECDKHTQRLEEENRQLRVELKTCRRERDSAQAHALMLDEIVPPLEKVRLLAAVDS